MNTFDFIKQEQERQANTVELIASENFVSDNVMAAEFVNMGYEVVTGGTDTHMFLLNLTNTHPQLTGKMVQDELDSHGIMLNKNTVPDETRSPMQASGLRIGTPAQTTRGWKEQDFIDCAHKIDEIIKEM